MQKCRRLTYAAVLLMVVAAATVLGCGPEVNTVTVGDHSMRVVIREYEMSPGRIVTGAGTVKFTATNRGRLAHNLVLMRSDRTIKRTTSFQQGDSEGFVADLKPHGSYRLISTLDSDQQLGIRAKVEVR